MEPLSVVAIFSTLNISEMTRDRAIVTIEHQQEVICALPNSGISSDLETRFSKSLHFWSRISCGQSYYRTLL